MIVIWLVLVACTDIPIQFIEDDDMMTIDKAELSEETTDILKALDHQAYFFDSKVDDTIEKLSINFWIYDEQEEWEIVTGSLDPINSRKNRIVFQIDEDSYDIIHMSDSGFTKSSLERVADFSNSSMIVESPLANPTTIEPGEEIILWVRLGTNKDILSTGGDFRDKDINAGMALTVTFHDDDSFMNSSEWEEHFAR